MPYSSNPLMYPPELLTLIGLLERTQKDAILIPVGTRNEAMAKRTQIQAFFSALGKHAKAYRALAERTNDKRIKAAQLAAPTKEHTAPPQARAKVIRSIEEDSQDAAALAGLWEGRYETAMSWMVRSKETPEGWCVELAKRTLGDFGAKMLAAFGDDERPAVGNGSPSEAHGADAPAGDESAIPPKQALVTEGVTAPVETSVEAMLAKARRELQEKIDSGELPQKGV